jgi:hypothetical protein
LDLKILYECGAHVALTKLYHRAKKAAGCVSWGQEAATQARPLKLMTLATENICGSKAASQIKEQ